MFYLETFEKDINANASKTVVANVSREVAEEISEYLTYKGIDSMLHVSNADSYNVLVSPPYKKDAIKLIEQFKLMKRGEYSSTDSSSNIKEAPHSTTFAELQKKISEISTSPFFFIISGIIVLAMSILSLLGIVAKSGESVWYIIVELVIGILIIIFGMFIFFRKRRAKRHVAYENAFSLKVIGWFLGTYSTLDIDKIIEAEKNAPSSESRKALIRKYIYREYSIKDEKYLSFLTSEVYIAMYHTKRLAGSSLRQD